MQTSQYQYVCLPTKWPPKKHSALLDAMFNFWHKSWLETYGEAGLRKTLSADDFFKHSESSAIFLNGQVVALLLFDCFDSSNPIHLESSYFEGLSSSNKLELSAMRIGNCLTFGQLAVAPAFRKAAVPLTDLIVGLGVLRLAKSGFAGALAMSRNSRKIHLLVHRLGGRSLFHNLIVNNEPCDLGLFTPNEVPAVLANPLGNYIRDLWERRILIPNDQKPFSKIITGEIK